ncbi:unnamed protein product [Eruca vesicaria subsp. sativa]|uniref:NYN domain-containing protein n=1 Tax=Eruca vesicaria subsp. sativa TaxID=29727 RepID=A0ABC8J012_ERUVS|nr:unnamed protein product [Eruca vesicaria subsp. sativa]
MSVASIVAFWDIDQCMLGDHNACVVTQRIKKALFDAGHRGKVTIMAYGDEKDHDFLSAGVTFTHFPAGDDVARHTKMLEDIRSWSCNNPNPSNLFLIMGDPSIEDFLPYIQTLKSSRHYKIHYVHPCQVQENSTPCLNKLN